MDNRIRKENGKLTVPDKPIIPYIEGDGIGADIWRAAMPVLNGAIEKAYKGRRKIEWIETYAGEKAFDKFYKWLPNETLETFKKYLVGVKGPLTTPVGGGISSLNVALRQTLDLYVCLRPVKYYGGIDTPTRNPGKVDMVVFRENTEDIYTGIEFEPLSDGNNSMLEFLKTNFRSQFKKIRFGDIDAVNKYLTESGQEPVNEVELGIGIKIISKPGTERLMTAALNYAIEHGRKKITIVHKGNIMKFTSGAFENWAYDIAEKKFGNRVFTMKQYAKIFDNDGKEAAKKAKDKAFKENKIFVNDVIADNALQKVLIAPEEFDIIATENLNGDYISDAIAAQVGGIGIAPGGNINFVKGAAIFEATHGTAPVFANLDKVNPSSLILSGKMMLEYLGWKEAADLIEKGLRRTIENKTVTFDFAEQMPGAKEVKCSEFGKLIIKNFD